MAIDLVRETALKILYDINENNAYSNISVDKHLKSGNLKELDRSFATELVYGTVKWLLQIDYFIEKYSSVKPKKLSPWIKNILRMGIYQILHTDRIPVSAACNTSVELAKRYGHQASSRFVNAILRNVAKNAVNLPFPEKSNRTEYLSIVYSHPGWLVEKWISLFGYEFTEALLKSNNEVPDFSVRVNSLKASREQLIDLLHKEGVSAGPGKYLDEAAVLETPSSIVRLDAFKNGLFQVQDESSMLAARVLNPEEGDLVIDVCSAPGGKATHIAQLMNNRGTVIARDIYPHKLNLINESAARLGIGIIKTEVFDACEFDEKMTGKADKVLVDAPCTGLGIIRKKPDIKYTKNINQTDEIVHLQRKILCNAAKYVRVGGSLVYSTCTILPEENLDNVTAFLSENKNFKLKDFGDLLPESLKMQSCGDGYIQLYPNVNKTDGFFISKLIREE